MSPALPVPLTLLTGFLGAGKTTLLNRLLRDPAFAATAVLINEHGEVGVDHHLVERIEPDLLVLQTGCICCAARGDLVDRLETLLDGWRAGRLRFRRLVVETTGIGDPRPILDAVAAAPALQGRCRVESIATVIDARDGEAVLDRHEVARRQAALADTLLLSKLDALADPRSADGLEASLEDLNPLAPVLDARDLAAVVAALLRPGAVLRPRRPARPHRHVHGEIESAALRAGAIEARHFEAFLALVADRHGPDLLRLKGFVALAENPSRPVLVQLVGARLHEVRPLDGWPDSDRSTRLVVIADGGRIDAIRRLWDDMFGPPAVDRPDAAALLDRIGSAGPGLF